MSMLRRPHDHHPDLPARRDAVPSANSSNDQDRHFMTAPVPRCRKYARFVHWFSAGSDRARPNIRLSCQTAQLPAQFGAPSRSLKTRIPAGRRPASSHTQNLSQNCRLLSIRYKCRMIRLTDEQWERIRDHFPEENIADGRPGRKPIPTRCVLEAVLWILNTGAQWHMLPQSYPNYKTVHRRFQTWCRDEVLRRVLTDVANELRDSGALNEEECFIDATFVMAKGGGSEIGATKRGKGMKIMAIVDRHGLPLSVSTHAANHHEVRLVQLCFDFYMIEAKPENLIGDRAYDSDPLDAELRKGGIEMIAPHRGNRSKPPTQDRRRLSRYMRRWLVERFFAWIQWQRRILIRWEYHAHNFLCFVQLACLVILFKRF